MTNVVGAQQCQKAVKQVGTVHGYRLPEGTSTPRTSYCAVVVVENLESRQTVALRRNHRTIAPDAAAYLDWTW